MSDHSDYLGHEGLFCTLVLCSCHLLLISSASVRSILFLSFIETIFTWNVPLISIIFLKRSLVSPILLFSSSPLHWSLRKAFLSYCYSLEFSIQTLISFLFFSFSLSFSFHFLFFHSYCASLHFFSMGMFLIPVSCIMSQTSVHSSSGTLSIRSNPLNPSLPLYNRKGFDSGHTWMV